MICLAILAAFSGLGLIAKMIAWCIDTWKEADREDKERRFEKNSNMMSFEEFSRMMKTTDLKLGE